MVGSMNREPNFYADLNVSQNRPVDEITDPVERKKSDMRARERQWEAYLAQKKAMSALIK